MRILKRVLIISIILGVVVISLAVWRIESQGLALEHLPSYVSIDRNGVPTVKAHDWPTLIERQGYIVASERMWQMDLLRRLAAGRLSEWFGQVSIESDIQRVKEDWLGVADRAAENMPEAERLICDAYAKGVNRFIKEEPGRWGLEYDVLTTKPEPWLCRDSLLIVLHMAQYLSSNIEREMARTKWREILTDEWFNFLFPIRHPWASPMFGKQNASPLKLPPEWQALPREKFRISKVYPHYKSEYVPGSNAWAWTSNEETLLAGDLHLRYSVPQVWYAMRLRISPTDWVVGGALPGIPGIVIGMNPRFAWSFTNTGDDQDDVLVESLDSTGERYLAFKEGDREVWRRLFVKHRRIKVRGAEDQVVEVSWTHRGPVFMNHSKPNQVLVRQWTALKPGVLGLPVVALNQASDFEEMNHALDRLGTPSLSIIYADREGRIGYRATGVKVAPHQRSDLLKEALTGEWTEFDFPADRPRVLLTPESHRKFLVAANAQIWTDKQPHHWASDDRRRRIVEMLQEMKTANVEVFQHLQLDVHSKFHLLLINWVIANYPAKSLVPWRERLMNWNGYADSDPAVFTFATWAEKSILSSLIGRVLAKFADEKLPIEYRHRLERVWLLSLFDNSKVAKIFGTTNAEIVAELISSWMNRGGPRSEETYQVHNSFSARHPFYGRLPILGALFKVRSFPQVGFRQLVRAEDALRGPSMRIIFDLRNIYKSSWSFPIGQSGHVRSPHYRNWQSIWQQGNHVPIFSEGEKWE